MNHLKDGTQQFTEGTIFPQLKGSTKKSRYPQVKDINTKLENKIKSMMIQRRPEKMKKTSIYNKHITSPMVKWKTSYYTHGIESVMIIDAQGKSTQHFSP